MNVEYAIKLPGQGDQEYVYLPRFQAHRRLLPSEEAYEAVSDGRVD